MELKTESIPPKAIGAKKIPQLLPINKIEVVRFKVPFDEISVAMFKMYETTMVSRKVTKKNPSAALKKECDKPIHN